MEKKGATAQQTAKTATPAAGAKDKNVNPLLHNGVTNRDVSRLP